MKSLHHSLGVLLVAIIVIVNHTTADTEDNVANFVSVTDDACPATFTVTFDTDVSTTGDEFTAVFTRSWAPLGVCRFYDMIKANFLKDAAFFRIVPNFVVQFGIAGEPAMNADSKWSTPIADDPVPSPVVSNEAGYISFASAGPNTRTTQVFINLINNARLDGMGFRPIGKIVSGLEVVKAIYNPTPNDSGGVDQDSYMKQGNNWIKSQYPAINFVVATKLVNNAAK